jgi:outer membrane protein assembly factor BamB
VYSVRADGTEKWRFQTDASVGSSPAVAADGTVYVGSRDTRVYALTSSGSLRWSYAAVDTVETAPALGADGTVYVTTSGGRVFALDRNGVERWRFPRADQPALNGIYSSPAVRSDGVRCDAPRDRLH